MNTNIYSQLYQTLKSGKGVVLIRIVRRQGSAPRGVGSSCFVSSDGTVYGSIGGGLLEHRAIEKAKFLFKNQVTSLSVLELTSKEIAADGMICGGKVELFFEPISAEDTAAVELFGCLAEFLQNGERGTLITRVSDGVQSSAPNNRMLVKKDCSVTGCIPGAPPVEQAKSAHLKEKEEGNAVYFLEPIRNEPELFLFGGGHIGVLVSPLAKMIGFQVNVFDDRNDFANRKRFPDADAVYAMPYEEAFEKINITENSYIVIVTRGHMGDHDILDMVLKLPVTPAYIGMIGSVRKRNTIFQALKVKGASEKKLSQIFCPIGLDIGAQTPGEIAVSIIAEIIRIRSDRPASMPVPLSVINNNSPGH